MACSSFVLLCAALGQVEGMLDKHIDAQQKPSRTDNDAMKGRAPDVAVSLTEDEAHFEQRIASGTSVESASDSVTVPVAATEGQCDWRTKPNCWSDIVWDYLRNQENHGSACLSKELEAKRSLDGVLSLVNEAADETARRNTTLHEALENIHDAIQARHNQELVYNASMIACQETVNRKRKDELLPFYLELQELAHIANPTHRSVVKTDGNYASGEATAAGDARTDSLTSLVELQSGLDSGLDSRSLSDMSQLDTSSLRDAGRETCQKFSSFVQAVTENHKGLVSLKADPNRFQCQFDGNRIRIDLERNFTYAYLVIAGLYDQMNQEIANETYTCVENALKPMRDVTSESNTKINASIIDVFDARAIITVLVPILQDLDLAELNLWQAEHVIDLVCTAEYNPRCLDHANKKIEGVLLLDAVVQSVEDCSAMCTGHAECEGFAFRIAGRQCSLYDNATLPDAADPAYASALRCEGGAGRPTTGLLHNADLMLDAIRTDIEGLGPTAGQNTFTLDAKTWTPPAGWWEGTLVVDYVYPKQNGEMEPVVKIGEEYNTEFNAAHGSPSRGYTLGYGYGNADDPPDAPMFKWQGEHTPYAGGPTSGASPWGRASAA